MADIYRIYGRIKPTGESFYLDVELEDSAKLLTAILKQNPNIGDAKYVQRF